MPSGSDHLPLAKNLTLEAMELGRLAAIELMQSDEIWDSSTLHFRGGMELVRRGCDDTDHRRLVFEGAFFGTIFAMR